MGLDRGGSGALVARFEPSTGALAHAGDVVAVTREPDYDARQVRGALRILGRAQVGEDPLGHTAVGHRLAHQRVEIGGQREAGREEKRWMRGAIRETVERVLGGPVGADASSRA